MKVTKKMGLAYEVDMLWSAIMKDPRFSKVNPKTGKAMYFPTIRYCCDNEMGKICDVNEAYKKATTDEARLKVLKDVVDTLGVDGAVYRGAEHTNNNLIPGQSYMFFFVVKSKEDIAKALICIKDVRNASQKLENDQDYTYSTAAYAFPATKEMKARRFEGTYGRVWGDNCLAEIHLPVEEFGPNFLVKDSVIPDMQTWQDNHYKTSDIELLIEAQKSSFMDKNSPLNFEIMKRYLETSSKYPATYSLVEDLYEAYYVDVKEKDIEDDASYDQDEEEEEEYDETKDFSEYRSEEEFQEQELKEIVSGILTCSSYTNAQKKELLALYGQTLNADEKIAVLAQKSGFNYTPAQKKDKEPEAIDSTPKSPVQ